MPAVEADREVGYLDVNSAALKFAGAALFVGLLYVAVSVYWGLGGTWLLDTVSRSLGRRGYAGGADALVAIWAAVVLKTTAAVLPLLVVRPRGSAKRIRVIRVLTWIEAAVLTTYGFVLTSVGLLVQAHVIHAAATADHRALAWHAYLWDPWFLIWGLLVLGALRAPPPASSNASRQRHA